MELKKEITKILEGDEKISFSHLKDKVLFDEFKDISDSWEDDVIFNIYMNGCLKSGDKHEHLVLGNDTLSGYSLVGDYCELFGILSNECRVNRYSIIEEESEDDEKITVEVVIDFNPGVCIWHGRMDEKMKAHYFDVLTEYIDEYYETFMEIFRYK